MSALEQLLSQVEYDTNGGCWLWAGSVDAKGYGRAWIGKGSVPSRTHRYAYEAVRGPIPPGNHLDHLCRVRCCCNPSHLEAVTPLENNRRAFGRDKQNALKTHCPRGHEYSPDNTYTCRRGKRSCLACKRELRRLRAQR